MSLDVGFRAQVPSLPDVGGASSSLGETFSAEPSTGTADFSINLDTPNGPNDIGPRLSLHYDSTAGNGPFGLGFALRLPRIVRSIAHGYPRYAESDPLMLESAGELLMLPDGSLQPVVDGGLWRIKRQGEGFELTDRGGSIYSLGVSADARMFDATGGEPNTRGTTFAWHLERIEDALGNAAVFGWARDGNQLLLASIDYGPFSIVFKYDDRPDVLRWSRCGFLVTTRRRCADIELRLPREQQPLLRRWRLDFAQHELNGCSLLAQVTMTGVDATGATLDSPAQQLAYAAGGSRTFARMQTVDAGVSPGPLQRSGQRVELVDWFGSGLPDLLEISGAGYARAWPNLGGLTWGRPRAVGNLPMFSTPDAKVAFVDMDGDGLADLIRADRPLSAYVPRTRAGFSLPVNLRRAPPVAVTDAAARLIDIDGDGAVDLLVADGNALAIYSRDDALGWSSQPRIVPRGDVPVAELRDPHIFMADMTGSGSCDLVRVDGAGVTYWPSLGFGRFGDAVAMASPPQLPFDFLPSRMFLQDIDGDGCADLIYIDQSRLQYWMNQTGTGFSVGRRIDFLPIAAMSETRWADMTGTGAAGLLWSAILAGRTVYFFLDFVGGVRPYLLERLDNGCGLETSVEYSTSAREAARDLGDGVPWATSMPIVVPVVAAIERREALSGVVSRTEYHYHDGRYDGVLREFAGFGRVETNEIGDTTAPSLQQTSWFHSGLAQYGSEPRATPERMAARALRGRMYRKDRRSLDGSPVQDLPFDRQEQTWFAEPLSTPAGMSYRPRMQQSRTTSFERTGAAVTVRIVTNTAWDATGNLTDSTEVGTASGSGLPDQVLRTHSDFATDATGRFRSMPWRTQQFDATGKVVSAVIVEYDHALPGHIGAQGLVTRRSALVLTDALATEIYAGAVPDFAALGYFRWPGEDGWWVAQASYNRIDDAAGLRGTTTDAGGAESTFVFDADRMFPISVTDPLGNVTTSTYDARIGRVVTVTDASGAVLSVRYDQMARLVARIDPGDNDALPTREFTYVLDGESLSVERRQRAISGLTSLLVARDLYDGSGRVIEQRESDGSGEIAVMSRRYGARGQLAREWRPFRTLSAIYGDPGNSLPSTVREYDALGRLVRVVNPDGSIRSTSYGPLLIEDADEEDTRTDAGAAHRDTPTRKWLDAAGRVVRMEQKLAQRWLSTAYEYDVKGNLIRHTDEAGNEVRFWFDLLGRQLGIRRPERDARVVRDPRGMPVESRVVGVEPVFRSFDALGRMVALRIGSQQVPALNAFTYHDAGLPAPPDAGAHTLGGRLVRIDDEAGSTVFDYDARGRQSMRRWQAVGDARIYEVNVEFRADGRVTAITYPDDGTARRRVENVYDLRGRLVGVPGVVPRIDVDVAGQTTLMEFANGTTLAATYDDNTGRALSRVQSGPSGWQRATAFEWDRVGNLVAIQSADNQLAAVHVYDDLYRLAGVDTALGEHYAYKYADNGAIAFKSDVGDYRYGEAGAPPTCLTSAGGASLSYTASGEIASAPWGKQTFDALGRLRRIERDDQVVGQFVYNWSGRRVGARTVDAQGVTTTRVTPDAMFSIEGGVLVLNLFTGDQIVATQGAGSDLTYLHVDQLGSVVATSDSTGQLIDTLRYDPFGRLLERGTSKVPPSFGFGGGIMDGSAPLLYLQARYYHPGLGIFVSVDPVVQHAMNPIAWAAYAYCGNNPTTRVDPSGLSFNIFKFLAGVVAVTAIVALAVVSAGTFAPEAVTLAASAEAMAASTYVAVGALTGAAIGGLSVARYEGTHGGVDPWDVLLGAAVGAAVAGWATYATVFGVVGPGKLTGGGLGDAVFGAQHDVLSGTLNNTVTQLAAGFAHAIAKPIAHDGDTCDFLLDMLQSLISGAWSGATQTGALSQWQPARQALNTAQGEIAASAGVVGLEQVVTSQINWSNSYPVGTIQNSLLGGAMDGAATMGGYYVLGGWG